MTSSLLEMLGGEGPKYSFGDLGYQRNPFPVRGEVRPDVFVRRKELAEVIKTLDAFLHSSDGPQGQVWAIQGEHGRGKSNFVQNLEIVLQTMIEKKKVTATACFRLPPLSLSATALLDALLQAIGLDRIKSLINTPSVATAVPENLRHTDFGQFWKNAQPTDDAAAFLMRWLAGKATRKAEREPFLITGRERLVTAVSFVYVRALITMLEEQGILRRIVILLDELEDLHVSRTRERNEYSAVLKTLINTFNWKGLFVILTGAPSVFATIAQEHPSLAQRWRSVALLPVGSASEAMELAKAYKQIAVLSAQADTGSLYPSDGVVAKTFDEIKKSTGEVSHRDLLHRLHELVGARATPPEAPV